MKPIRIKRERTKGFKLPPNTLCVTRGTRYGNPFKVGELVNYNWFKRFDKSDIYDYFQRDKKVETNEEAVLLFEKYLDWIISPSDLMKLKGKNLACWCKNSMCHATVLLELSNEDL